MNPLALAVRGIPADPFDTPEVRVELALEAIDGALRELEQSPAARGYGHLINAQAGRLADLAVQVTRGRT